MGITVLPICKCDVGCLRLSGMSWIEMPVGQRVGCEGNNPVGSIEMLEEVALNVARGDR
jgi:hypothetical protein